MAEQQASAGLRGGVGEGGDGASGEARSGHVSVLFVGDVVGGLGRRTLLDCLPVLRERYAPTFVVVNGENAAGEPGHNAEDRGTDVRRRGGRDHARQPLLLPA
jgi:hypothetical protein